MPFQAKKQRFCDSKRDFSLVHTRNYTVELWGKNLTDELYVNGGFDTRDIWGYDFSIVGRSREVGLSLSFTF
jgi:outer membrane receptor protein involved in Fe transport